jgi:hypothetical protein
MRKQWEEYQGNRMSSHRSSCGIPGLRKVPIGTRSDASPSPTTTTTTTQQNRPEENHPHPSSSCTYDPSLLFAIDGTCAHIVCRVMSCLINSSPPHDDDTSSSSYPSHHHRSINPMEGTIRHHHRHKKK